MRVKPKKRLGQNFLVDKNIQRKLIASYDLKPHDAVLEIGAGRGELTKLIADKVAFLFALEIDPGLYEILRDALKDYPNAEPIRQDILKFNLKKCIVKLKNKLDSRSFNPSQKSPGFGSTALTIPSNHPERSRRISPRDECRLFLLKEGAADFSPRGSTKLKVVGNIPYYITSPIIGHLLKYRQSIETIFITVQKEFGKRIVATAGSKEYGSFSCFVQYYAIPKIIFFIKKGCFSPSPKVDSCLLQLKIRQAPAVKVENERLFFKIIRGSFGKRRKTLRNSLEGIFPIQKVSEFFKNYQIDSNARPEDLTLQDFANLTNL